MVDAEQPFLTDFVERLGRECLRLRPGDEVRFVGVVVKSHPFAIANGSGTETAPVDFFFADSHSTDVLEEEQRQRALQPFMQVLLNLATHVVACESHAYRRLLPGRKIDSRANAVR